MQQATCSLQRSKENNLLLKCVGQNRLSGNKADGPCRWLYSVLTLREISTHPKPLGAFGGRGQDMSSGKGKERGRLSRMGLGQRTYPYLISHSCAYIL